MRNTPNINTRHHGTMIDHAPPKTRSIARNLYISAEAAMIDIINRKRMKDGHSRQSFIDIGSCVGCEISDEDFYEFTATLAKIRMMNC